MRTIRPSTYASLVDCRLPLEARKDAPVAAITTTTRMTARATHKRRPLAIATSSWTCDSSDSTPGEPSEEGSGCVLGERGSGGAAGAGLAVGTTSADGLPFASAATRSRRGGLASIESSDVEPLVLAML